MSDTIQRVRDLIADSGTSQADFAEAIGLDASKISKSLGGARRFSSLDLARIAEHANVTVDWLLTGEEAPLAIAARAHIGSTAEAATAAARRLAELRESAARLGYAQQWRIPDIAMPSGKAYEQGEALADQVYAVLRRHANAAGVLDLPLVIESEFGIDVCLTPLGDGFDGLALATEDARMILASVTPQAYRQRFTLAHELAHVVIGDNQEVHLDEDVYSASTKRDPSEIRANAFAAALLMPRELLLAEVTQGFDKAAFARLSARLRVTPRALGYRLFGLHLIDDMTNRLWGAMTSAQAAKGAEAASMMSAATQASSTPRPPGLLARDVMQAYLDGKSTLRLYAELVGLDTEALRVTLEQADPGGM